MGLLGQSKLSGHCLRSVFRAKAMAKFCVSPINMYLWICLWTISLLSFIEQLMLCLVPDTSEIVSKKKTKIVNQSIAAFDSSATFFCLISTGLSCIN